VKPRIISAESFRLQWAQLVQRRGLFHDAAQEIETLKTKAYPCDFMPWTPKLLTAAAWAQRRAASAVSVVSICRSLHT
jgi:hypothetical protein